MTSLNTQWLRVLESYSIDKALPADTAIYRTNEKADVLYIVKKGRIRVYAITGNGEEVNYEVLGKGKIFGETCLLEKGIRPVNASTVTETVLLMLSKESFESLVQEYPSLSILLMKMMAESNNTLCDALRIHKEYNSFQKVVYFLLKTTEKEVPENGIRDGILPYTHQDIANSLQMHRVTVSKVLDTLQNKGYIRMKYKCIQVVKRTEMMQEYLI